jgi:hypothetical protein
LTLVAVTVAAVAAAADTAVGSATIALKVDRAMNAIKDPRGM